MCVNTASLQLVFVRLFVFISFVMNLPPSSRSPTHLSTQIHTQWNKMYRYNFSAWQRCNAEQFINRWNLFSAIRKLGSEMRKKSWAAEINANCKSWFTSIRVLLSLRLSQMPFLVIIILMCGSWWCLIYVVVLINVILLVLNHGFNWKQVKLGDSGQPISIEGSNCSKSNPKPTHIHMIKVKIVHQLVEIFSSKYG